MEGQASVHDPVGAKVTVRVLQQAIDDLMALPAFQGLTVHATGGYFFVRRASGSSVAT